MSPAPLPNDPMWPRAAHWIESASAYPDAECDLAIVGVPAHRTSITPTGAHATPGAIREALLRYSTYSAANEIDVATLRALDFGDVRDPDANGGEARTEAAVAEAIGRSRLTIILGGDNSVTYAAARGLARATLGSAAPDGIGLVTVDAHHDLRDGVSNGSPVRRLAEDGLPGANVVQIGIADFANSPAYTERARDLGITVVPRSGLRDANFETVARRALDVAGADGRPIYVDLDVDVCDRAEVPGCPSAAPGGISADELRQLAFFLARDPHVRALDLTEIDATIDAKDGRTVRLAALLVLEAAAGLAARER